MVVSYYRPTKAIINTTAIKENVANEKARLTNGQEMFVAVKANGYGHGAIASAQAAISGGADGFCVATLDEGLELRAAGLTQPIIVLGVVPAYACVVAANNDIAVPMASMEWFEQTCDLLTVANLVQPLKVHLKVDTGMGRIGFLTPAEVKQAYDALKKHPQAFNLQGIFMHYATADEKDLQYWEKQKARFTRALAILPETPRYVHMSNSATALWHEDHIGNMVRYGVGMYGLNPSGTVLSETYPLQPALSLQSELVHVKQMPKGESISYGATYTTTETEWIGTVPIGYADGWIRKMQGFHVLVDGQFCEIVGRVCMDQIMIRLPKQYALGTKVVLVGQSGNKQISLQDIADHLDTIHYEVACLIATRVPREYQS